jgi:hyperosmotically inducible protein
MNILRAVGIALVAVLGFAQLQACTPTESRRSTGETVDDSSITARVKTALLSDPDVKGTDVKVETYRGVVQLSGFVDSPQEAEKAVQLAQKVPGVREVKNDIRLKPTS